MFSRVGGEEIFLPCILTSQIQFSDRIHHNDHHHDQINTLIQAPHVSEHTAALPKSVLSETESTIPTEPVRTPTIYGHWCRDQDLQDSPFRANF